MTTNDELGRVLSEHHGRLGHGGTAWLVGGAMLPWLFLGPAAVVQVIWSGGLGGLAAYAPALVGILVAMLLGPLILWFPVLRWRQSATVYERGLVHRGLLGTTVVRADEVTEVRHTRIRRKYSRTDEVEIGRRGARPFFIVGIADADQLVNVVHAWTRPAAARAPVAAPPSGAWVPPGAA